MSCRRFFLPPNTEKWNNHQKHCRINSLFTGMFFYIVIPNSLSWTRQWRSVSGRGFEINNDDSYSRTLTLVWCSVWPKVWFSLHVVTDYYKWRLTWWSFRALAHGVESHPSSSDKLRNDEWTWIDSKLSLSSKRHLLFERLVSRGLIQNADVPLIRSLM